jgi:hypothetical protein
MALVIEMVVHRGVNWDQFLQTSYVPKSEHCIFPSPKRELRIFTTVVYPAAGFLTGFNPNHLHRGAIDFFENFIQMLFPIRTIGNWTHPLLANFTSEHRAKTVPPKLDSLVADVIATLLEQIFDIT